MSAAGAFGVCTNAPCLAPAIRSFTFALFSAILPELDPNPSLSSAFLNSLPASGFCSLRSVAA